MSATRYRIAPKNGTGTIPTVGARAAKSSGARPTSAAAWVSVM
jgi:hypothetical protein